MVYKAFIYVTIGFLLAGAAAPAMEELTEAERAYARKWTAAELGEELLQMTQWWGNDLGRDKDVPGPWVPLRIDGQTVITFGQRYEYTDSLFPVQIVSNGEALFAEPVSVIVTGGGSEYSFQAAEVSMQQLNDGEVFVTTLSRSGPLQLTLTKLYEFDGMAKVDFTLASLAGAVEIERVELVFALKGERAKLYHYMDAVSNKPPTFSHAGFLPPEGFVFNRLRELIWLGDHYRGFCWFAEGTENWQLQNTTGIQRLMPRADGATEIRIKLADRAFALTAPWHIVFGMQATPTRPMLENRRILSDRNRAALWRWDWGDGGTYYPFWSNPEPARQQVESMREQGREVMPSSSQRFYSRYRNHLVRSPRREIENPGLIHRELLLWERLWHQGETSSLHPVPEKHTAPGDWFNTYGPGGLTGLCANSPFQDYYLWRLQRTIEETGLGAIYLDQPMGTCGNRHHGCGYINFRGEWTRSAPIFARREFQKRMYKIFQEKHGFTRIMWHSSNQIIIPVISFTDIFLDGEEYSHTRTGNPVSFAFGLREFYSDILSQDKMQAQHTGLPFGFAPSLLSKFRTSRAPSIASVTDMMGYFLVHDSHVRMAWTPHNDLGSYINDIWFRFPFADSRQYYYWEDNAGLSVGPAEALYIAHVTDADMMVILHNPGVSPFEVSLMLDSSRLGLQNSKVAVLTDTETKQVFDQQGATFQIPLAPKDIRILGYGTWFEE